MSDEQGRIDFELPEPNFVRARFIGKLTGPELTELFDAIDAHSVGSEFVLIEADMSGIDSAAPEARRLAAERISKLPPCAIAIVGGGFAQRMIGKLVLTAVSMLTAGRTKSGFFKDSNAAAEWLWGFAKDRFGYERPKPL